MHWKAIVHQAIACFFFVMYTLSFQISRKPAAQCRSHLHGREQIWFCPNSFGCEIRPHDHSGGIDQACKQVRKLLFCRVFFYSCLQPFLGRATVWPSYVHQAGNLVWRHCTLQHSLANQRQPGSCWDTSRQTWYLISRQAWQLRLIGYVLLLILYR